MKSLNLIEISNVLETLNIQGIITNEQLMDLTSAFTKSITMKKNADEIIRQQKRILQEMQNDAKEQALRDEMRLAYSGMFD